MRALFVGGVVAGQILEVGDPPPAEHQARNLPGLIVMSDQRAGEDRYYRRDVAIEWEPGKPTEYVVYLATLEVAALGDPRMFPHVLRHVTRMLVESGHAVRPGARQG